MQSTFYQFISYLLIIRNQLNYIYNIMYANNFNIVIVT